MLIEFNVGNFRSFKEVVTLSMVAANITSQDKSVDENNLIPIDDRLSLLTSAVVYGANASGKSNLVQAFVFMRDFVQNSSRESQAGDEIEIEPFRLSTATENQPAYFEVVFILDDIKYRYGFEVTQQRVEREWLYTTPTIREAELFIREKNQIHYNRRSFREGRNLTEKTRSNALFLSVASQFNGPISLSIQRWFRKVGVISGLNDVGYRQFTVNMYLENKRGREIMLQLVRALDLDIDQIEVTKVAPSEVAFPQDMPEELKSLLVKEPGDFYSIATVHKKLDPDGKEVDRVSFDLEENESNGTQKLFFLSGPLIDTLERGDVLVVDEMEARMHPLITCAIIHLFNSKETNPRRAQLIFTTHDTNLLDRKLFRRDQIWFIEKDHSGASHLYSLVEFKPRYDASFEKDYLRGKYGAIPFLGDLNRILGDELANMAEATES